MIAEAEPFIEYRAGISLIKKEVLRSLSANAATGIMTRMNNMILKEIIFFKPNTSFCSGSGYVFVNHTVAPSSHTAESYFHFTVIYQSLFHFQLPEPEKHRITNQVRYKKKARENRFSGLGLAKALQHCRWGLEGRTIGFEQWFKAKPLRNFTSYLNSIETSSR